MWGAVSTATGAAATGGSTLAVATAASSSKLLVVGALFGSALTLGAALAVVRAAPSVVMPRRGLSRETVEIAPYAGERSSEEPQPIPLMIDTLSSSAASAHSSAQEGAPAMAKANPRAAPARVGVEDPLMREAALVAEARGALVRSDARAALSLLDGARRVGSRDLEPEELSLRTRALRLLGREVEAAEIEVRLRSRYPDHFLSR
jgi:hypothetical protein